jgi:hypothetical protein
VSDARTEARRRIAAAVAPIQPRETGAFASAEEIADAVLDLFPEVRWAPHWPIVGHGPVPANERQLVLTGRVEPVTKESATKAATTVSPANYPEIPHRLVRREVHEWSDGSSWTGPWVEVTDA